MLGRSILIGLFMIGFFAISLAISHEGFQISPGMRTQEMSSADVFSICKQVDSTIESYDISYAQMIRLLNNDELESQFNSEEIKVIERCLQGKLPDLSSYLIQQKIGFLEGVGTHEVKGKAKILGIEKTNYLRLESFEIHYNSKTGNNFQIPEFHVYLSKGDTLSSEIYLDKLKTKLGSKNYNLPDVDLDVYDTILIVDESHKEIFAKIKLNDPNYLLNVIDDFIDYITPIDSPKVESKVIFERYGFFEGTDNYEAEGIVSLDYEEDEGELQLNNFEMSLGDDLRVYLTKNADVKKSGYWTLDSDGRVYISSGNTDQILRYGPDGTFEDIFVTSNSGGLSFPTGITFGPDGNLYVSSKNTDQILRYAPDGTFEDIFIDGGGLDGPEDITFGPDGNLYIVSNNGILRFDDQSRFFLDTFVAHGTGGLSFPTGITFGPDGNLYVGSGDTDQILRYAPDGTFEDIFVTSNSGGLDGPKDLIFSPNEKYLYVASFLNNEILRYDLFGNFIDNIVSPHNGEISNPQYSLFGPDGNLYVSSNNGILRFDDQSGFFLDTFVAHGTGGLSFPTGITFGPDGNLYVGSGDTDQILRYAPDGTFEDIFVTSNSGGLDGPEDITFGPDGNLYVSSKNTDQILRYAPDGTFEDIFVNSDVIKKPHGITFGPDGNLYIVSSLTDEILRFDNQNHNSIDIFASGGGLFNPADISIDEMGFFYVSSKNTDQILRYAPDGTFEDIFVNSDVIKKPHGITFGPDGNLYVVSNETNEVIKTVTSDPNLKTEKFVTDAADGLYQPKHLEVYDGKICVSNYITNDIHCYQEDNGKSLGKLTVSFDRPLVSRENSIVGPDGELYVSDSLDNKILRYDGVTGLFSGVVVNTENDPLQGPTSLTFGPDDNLYVSSDDKIFQFDGINGDFLSVFVSKNNAGLRNPQGLSFDENYLYANSYDNNRVLRYDALNGEFVDEFVKSRDHGLLGPLGSTIDDKNNLLYVVSQNTNKILQYNTQTGHLLNEIQLNNSPSNLVLGNDSVVFISMFETDSVLSYDTNSKQSRLLLSSEDNLDGPMGLSFDVDNSLLYVSSSKNNKIIAYDLERNTASDISISQGDGILQTPQGLAINNDALFISNNNNNEILKYDPKAKSLTNFIQDTADLIRPGGITFGPDSNLYVINENDNKVYQYDLQTGNLLGTFAEFLPSLDDDDSSTNIGLRSIVFSGDGKFLFASNPSDNNILVYDVSDRKYMDGIFTNDALLNYPTDLTISPDGKYLLVINYADNTISRFTISDNSGEIFVNPGNDGLTELKEIRFGHDEQLYVIGGKYGDDIYKYDGITGDFLEEYDSGGIYLGKLEENSLNRKYLLNEVDTRQNNVVTIYDHFLETSYAKIVLQDTIDIVTPLDIALHSVMFGFSHISEPKLVSMDATKNTGFFMGSNDVVANGQVLTKSIDLTSLITIQNFSFDYDEHEYVSMTKSANVFTRGPNLIACIVSDLSELSCDASSNSIELGAVGVNSGDNAYLVKNADLEKYSTIVIYDKTTEKTFANVPLRDYGILRISGESFVDWIYRDFFVLPFLYLTVMIFPLFFDYIRGAFKIIFFMSYFIIDKIKSRKPSLLPPLEMVNNKKISILIPAHNEEDGIKESIESAIRTYYPNKEIIVIDDGSTDDTWNIANSFAEKGLIKLIHREPAKSSKAAALNHGMNYATGDYVLCMDGDTKLDENALKNAAPYFADENAVAFSGNVKILSGDKGVENILTQLQKYEYMIAIELGRRFTSILNILLVISGAFGIFKKSTIRDLHTFDKDTLTEDFDLTLQFRKTLGRIQFISNSVAYTHCPAEWSAWVRQRHRWAYGQFQTLTKNKDLLRKHTLKDSLSFIDMYLLDITLSILFPIGLTALGVISLILTMGDNLHVLVYPLTIVVLLFLVLEFTIFLFAAVFSGKAKHLKLIYLFPLMTFFYRPYLKMINLRGYLHAIYHKNASW